MKAIHYILTIINKTSPPIKWRFPVIVISGILSGLGLYMLYVSNAPSYLSDNPKSCVNCHIMAPQFATWFHSSHRERATCNDCHVPEDNIFSHYYFKAKDGLRHASIFTLRLEPQVIEIKEAGARVVQQNCIRCHYHLFENPNLSLPASYNQKSHMDRPCWTCHRETPHGTIHSLASTPYARVPLLKSPIPGWLSAYLKLKY